MALSKAVLICVCVCICDACMSVGGWGIMCVVRVCVCVGVLLCGPSWSHLDCPLQTKLEAGLSKQETMAT